MKTYSSYLFKDKDPVIDQLRTIIKDEKLKFSDIAERSGVAHGTIAKWFYGDTKRPQHATIMAVCRAIGYDMRFVRITSAKVYTLKSK